MKKPVNLLCISVALSDGAFRFLIFFSNFKIDSHSNIMFAIELSFKCTDIREL